MKAPEQPKSRLAHFLTLPIGHHSEPCDVILTFWLAHKPPIEGLDPFVVISPHPLSLARLLPVFRLVPSSSLPSGQVPLTDFRLAFFRRPYPSASR